MSPYFQFYRGTTFKKWSRRKFFIANVFTNADYGNMGCQVFKRY